MGETVLRREDKWLSIGKKRRGKLKSRSEHSFAFVESSASPPRLVNTGVLIDATPIPKCARAYFKPIVLLCAFTLGGGAKRNQATGRKATRPNEAQCMPRDGLGLGVATFTHLATRCQ